MKLICELSKAVADVKWFKDGKELTPSKNIAIITDGKKRILTVRKAEKANIGEYSCDCGSDKTTAKVNIEGMCDKQVLASLQEAVDVLTVATHTHLVPVPIPDGAEHSCCLVQISSLTVVIVTFAVKVAGPWPV